MNNTFDFDKIVSAIDQQKRPALHLWNPELSGDIDISIDQQGVWWHCGDQFKRQQIPSMFARILCREQDQYFLKTPVEKWRIKVLDVPFYFIHLSTKETAQGLQLSLVSRTQDVVTLDQEHTLRLSINSETGEPTPYISVRGGMEGKLSRSLYYQLVELATIDEAAQQLFVSSAGVKIIIGSYR